MSTKGVIGITGLKTSGNELAFPPGALTQADNAIIPSKGVIQPRRGQPYFSTPIYIDNDPTDAQSNRAQEMWQWGKALFVSYTGGGGYGLSLFDDVTAVSPGYHAIGAYAPPDPVTMRMKFAELSKSAYWATQAGLYTIDKSGGTVRAAGIQRPRDFLLSDADSGLFSRLASAPDAAGTWLVNNAAVAYRSALGSKDANGVVRLSAPNGRLVVVNPADLVMATGAVVLTSNVVTVTLAAGQTHEFRPGDQVKAASTDGAIGTGPYTIATVTATTFTYPKTAANHASANPVTYSSGFKTVQLAVGLSAEATVGMFLQLYRTDESLTAAVDPGDEMFQAYERLLTATDISNGYVTIQDTTPSVFLGGPLPTNANTGDGSALGANERPPLCRDLCVWDSRLWGADVTERNRLQFRLLGVGSPAGLQTGDKVAINCRVFTLYTVYAAGLASENLNRTVSSLVGFIGTRVPGCAATSLYDGTTPTAAILVDEVGLASTFVDNGGGALDGIYAGTSRQTAFQDPLALVIGVNSGSRTAGVVTLSVTAHGMAQGAKFILALNDNALADANFVGGIKTVSNVVDANTIQYVEAGSTTSMSGTLRYVYATSFKSTPDTFGLRFSKPGEPEAWPLPNFPGGLPDGAEVLRVKPSPDMFGLLILLKNGDTYYLSGQYPYTVRRVDGSASLVAADTFIEHNNNLYGLTTQGVAHISSTGVGVVGLDIDDDTRNLNSLITNQTCTPGAAWALSYESDRQYQLWYPSDADDFAKNTFVFDSMNQGWTAFALPERSCGLVLKGSDYMVLGDASETNQLVFERKAFKSQLWTSFADRQTALVVSGDQTGVTNLEVEEVALGDATSGDALLVGGTYHRILSRINSSTIALADAVTVTDGQVVTAFRHFTTTITFAMEAAGIPGVDKVFREVQLHFGERLFSKLTVNFTNEKDLTLNPVTVVDSTFAFSTPKMGSTIIRVDVPENMQQSAQLKVSVTLAEAFSYFRLLGYSATSTPSSEKTGR